MKWPWKLLPNPGPFLDHSIILQFHCWLECTFLSGSWLLWLFFAPFPVALPIHQCLAYSAAEGSLHSRAAADPDSGWGSTWNAHPPNPARTAGPEDTRVNVAICWGSAGAASCLQLGNPGKPRETLPAGAGKCAGNSACACQQLKNANLPPRLFETSLGTRGFQKLGKEKDPWTKSAVAFSFPQEKKPPLLWTLTSSSY